MVPYRGDLSTCSLQSVKGQPEGLKGLSKGVRVGGQIDGQETIRGSEKSIGGTRGQLEGLRGQLEDLGVSQRVYDSQGVWRVKLGTISYNLSLK